MNLKVSEILLSQCLSYKWVSSSLSSAMLRRISMFSCKACVSLLSVSLPAAFFCNLFTMIVIMERSSWNISKFSSSKLSCVGNPPSIADSLRSLKKKDDSAF